MAGRPGDSDRGNEAKLEKLMKTLDRLSAKGLRRGFFGAMQLEVKIQDGVIQHVRAKLEEDLR